MVPPATTTSPATAVTAPTDGRAPTASRTSTSVLGITSALTAFVRMLQDHTTATIVQMVTVDLDVSTTKTTALATAVLTEHVSTFIGDIFALVTPDTAVNIVS